MNVYKTCPSFENERFVLRLVSSKDTEDLLKIYSDIKAAPFFNGDNCHGDDFHYTTLGRMQQAVDFWIDAYNNGWFVRWSIVDKAINEVVGTIEEFHRDADDYFTNCGLLRLDLRSDCEQSDIIESILSLIVYPSFDLFGCNKIATKCWDLSVARRDALLSLGFIKSSNPLIGFDGTKYYSYYILEK